MTAKDILNPDNWKGEVLRSSESGISIKYLEGVASDLHNIIDEINKTMIEGKFTLQTSIVGSKKESNYLLRIKIKKYGNKEKHKHKKNTHRQRINI